MTRIDENAGKQIDWANFHRRLEESHRATERHLEISPEKKAQILHDRALRIAEPKKDTAKTDSFIQVVEFSLLYEKYALKIEHTREVATIRNITRLPGAGGIIAGIINLRGDVVTVIDLAHYFGLPDRGLTEKNKAIVLQGGGKMLAILVDFVLGVRPLPLSEIYPPPSGLGERCLNLCMGVTKESMVVLDGGRIVQDSSLVPQSDNI